jgi:hypothetical protein
VGNAGSTGVLQGAVPWSVLRLKFVRDLAATRQIKTVKSLHPIPFDGTLFIRDLCAVRSSLSAI